MVGAPLDRLARSGRAYRDPLVAIAWDSLDPAQPWLPDDLVSLAGLPVWAGLAPAARRRLSHLEFLAMAELGLGLESLLLHHLGRAAPRALRQGAAAYAVLLSELREEAGHSLMFLELLRHAPRPAPPAPRPWLAAFARLVPTRTGLFWAAVLIGETVATELNRRIREEASLPLAVRQIADLHFADEVRHVAYARLRLAETLPPGAHPLAEPALRLLTRQFLAACFHPPAALYRGAGLAEPEALARAARANPARAALAAACLAPARRFLAGRGIGLTAPPPGSAPARSGARSPAAPR